MKLITHENIIKLNINPSVCYQWVEYMIKNKKCAILPPKISMKPQEGVFCNVMPSILNLPDGKYYGGVKLVSRYPQRKPILDSKLILFDADSGKCLSIMDANWITSMRTGAVAAHSIKLLAKSDFNTLAVLGLGNTARATLLVLSEIFSERQFNVKLLKYKGQEDIFIKRFQENSNLKFSVCDNIESLFKDADVIISAATYLPDDIADDKMFPEGVLLVPIHTLGFTNCDLFFDKIYADDLNHVCNFKNFNKFKYFSEVSDVVNNKSVGRENNSERILAYNIGISMHDIYFASKIYEMLKDSQSNDFDFSEPKDKFYI